MSEPLLLGGREEALRREIHGVRAPQLRRLLEECERYRGEVLPTEHPDASITYIGQAAANLALAHRLTGQQQYLDELRRWLEVAVAFPHWGKAHMPDTDLDAGWLLHGLGLAYSWAGDALPPGEKASLRDKLLLQGTRLYNFAVASEGDWWSSSYWQNHNWICYAGLATAGYVLAGEHPETLAWTDRAKNNFDIVLDMLADDGSNHEGVVYWRYGVPWLASYLDVLRAAEGIDWYPRSAHLRETFWFRLYQAAPDLERIVDHGDCHDHRSGHSVALYYKLAAEYRIPEAQWLADTVAEKFFWREAYESGVKPGIRAEAYQELLWYDPTVVAAAPDALPTSRVFPDLGLVSARTSWAPDATLLSFKASPGGGHKAWRESHRLAAETGWRTLNTGHHHPDAGSFVLLGGGEYLAIDEGYSSRKRTEHHNGILVDDRGFAGEDRYDVYRGMDAAHTATLLASAVVDGWVYALSDSAAMYDPALGVRRIHRHIAMSPTGTVFIVDDLHADTPRRWSWLLQTHNAAVPTAPGSWVAPVGPASLRISALADVNGEVTTTTDRTHSTAVHANPTASTPSLAIAKTQFTLRRTTKPATSARLVTVLETLTGDESPVARLTLTTSGDSYRVAMNDGDHRDEAHFHLGQGGGFSGTSATLRTFAKGTAR